MRKVASRRGPMLAGLLFFLLALLPVANLIPLNEPAAEHFLYLPMAGFAPAVASLAAPLYAGVRKAGRAGIVALCLALAGLGLTAGVQASVWSSAERLWTSVLKVNDGAERAHNNYGLAMLEAGNSAQAKQAFLNALRFGPRPARRVAANLMALCRSEGDLQTALLASDMVLRAHPDDPLILSLRGGILLEAGRVEEAREALERVARHPQGEQQAADSWARDRGIAWYLSGDPERGLALLRDAAQDNPQDPSILVSMGACLLDLDRASDAETVLRRALTLPGVSAMAHQNLAVALLKLGRAAEAAAQLNRAAAMGSPIPSSLAKAVAEAAHRDSIPPE
jgi:Flp pilus assembly protein TadD